MELVDLKGIGPSVLQKLEKLEIRTIKDLLAHYPSRYVDRSRRLHIFDLKFLEDESYHCIASIKNIRRFRMRGGRDVTTATFEDETGYISVMWFNNPYISSQYHNEEQVIFSGKILKGKISNPKIKKFNSQEDLDEFAKIESIYPETKGLKSYMISKYVYYALKQIFTLPDKEQKKYIPEILTKTILKKEHFIQKRSAVRIMHFPKFLEELDEARALLGFEEIYIILKKVAQQKKKIKKKPGYHITVNHTTHEELLSQLTFKLTESQKSAIFDIFKDLSEKEPMHRLLNGDVGSGKTIVAASAAWQVANNGLQSVILAPTGVLAKQHYTLFTTLFEGRNVPIHLITSDTKSAVKKLKESEQEEQNSIFIGTHALLYHLDLFNHIGLLVIDEQHKFGVKQRELLANFLSPEQSLAYKNSDYMSHDVLLPNVLSMSATPIPRSLALTFFGDIDVSFLEKPLERKTIITRVLQDKDLIEKMYSWVQEEVIQKKSQVYVVCPLIENSEKLSAKSATEEYERLQELFPEFKIGLLHGRIKQAEKDAILDDFKQGQYDILVSTSVIEVGIDNPNATIMIIENAERFGLAQLHQIRGRVGRSDKQSYCFLKTSEETPAHRLEYFAKTNDGFKVAEYDLHQRGPGEVYGEAQSGIPDIKIANILDLDLIKRVKKYIS